MMQTQTDALSKLMAHREDIERTVCHALFFSEGITAAEAGPIVRRVLDETVKTLITCMEGTGADMAQSRIPRPMHKGPPVQAELEDELPYTKGMEMRSRPVQSGLEFTVERPDFSSADEPASQEAQPALYIADRASSFFNGFMDDTPLRDQLPCINTDQRSEAAGINAITEKDGVFIINKELDMSGVKLDPVLKRLVDSVLS